MDFNPTIHRTTKGRTKVFNNKREVMAVGSDPTARTSIRWEVRTELAWEEVVVVRYESKGYDLNKVGRRSTRLRGSDNRVLTKGGLARRSRARSKRPRGGFGQEVRKTIKRSRG